jgi:hypothetical protein
MIWATVAVTCIASSQYSFAVAVNDAVRNMSVKCAPLAFRTSLDHVLIFAEYCARGSLYALLHSPHVHLSWHNIYFMCRALLSSCAA